MLIREKPFPILKIGNNIYKFLPPDLISSELDFLSIKKLLNIYNRKTNLNKFKIPTIKRYKLFTKTKYLGVTLFNSKKDVLDLYKCISDFSNCFRTNSLFTISLGDIQLRNVYQYKQDFYLLDLGKSAGKKVDFLYNQSRFLVHLIDCDMSKTVLEILKEEKKKRILLKAMFKRSLIVFKKRVSTGRIVSGFFRFFSFLNLIFKIYLK